MYKYQTHISLEAINTRHSSLYYLPIPNALIPYTVITPYFSNFSILSEQTHLARVPQVLKKLEQIRQPEDEMRQAAGMRLSKKYDSGV